ncbi:MAG: hypothetical protein JXR63_09625 [Spirochaetales bacterium]|nr:hypothetical protein [Spirochaetales bacterium]
MKKNFIFIALLLMLFGCDPNSFSNKLNYPVIRSHFDLSGATAVGVSNGDSNSRNTENVFGLVKVMEDGRIESLFRSAEAAGNYLPEITAIIQSPVTNDLFLVFSSNVVNLGGMNFSNIVRINPDGDLMTVLPMPEDRSSTEPYGFFAGFSDFRIEDRLKFDNAGNIYFIALLPSSVLVKYSIDSGLTSVITPNLRGISIDGFSLSSDSSKLLLSGKIGEKKGFVFLYDTNDMSGYKSVVYYGNGGVSVSNAVFLEDNRTFFALGSRYYINDDWTLTVKSELVNYYDSFILFDDMKKIFRVKHSSSTDFVDYELTVNDKSLQASGSEGNLDYSSISELIESGKAQLVLYSTSYYVSSSRFSFEGDELVEFLQKFEEYGNDLYFTAKRYTPDEIYDMANSGLVRDLEYRDISFDGKTGRDALDSVSKIRWFGSPERLNYCKVLNIDVQSVNNYISSRGAKGYFWRKSFFYDSTGALWTCSNYSIFRLYDKEGRRNVKVFESFANFVSDYRSSFGFGNLEYNIYGDNIFFKEKGEAPGTHKILMCSLTDETANYVDLFKNVPRGSRIQVLDFSASDDYFYFTGLVNFFYVISGSVDLKTGEFKPFETDLELSSIQVYRH